MTQEPEYGEKRTFYLERIQDLVDTFTKFHGEKSALMKARRAPLQIDPDGNVAEYYGKGENVLELLMQQYADFLGEDVAYHQARKIFGKKLTEEQIQRLPEKLRPRKKETNLLENILHKLGLH